MKKIKTTLKMAALFPLVILLLSCNPVENDSTSASIIYLDSLMGVDLEANAANYIQSDVLYEDSSTGATSIIADIATASMRAVMLSPALTTVPSQYNNVMMDRYVVSYFRSDGRNQPGVDVPHTFEGHLATMINIGSTESFGFVIVREVAKAEIPLINLREARDAGVLEVTAKVEFYGHDMANRNIKVVGYISIFFANYSNE